jgi:hypothetical protein
MAGGLFTNFENRRHRTQQGVTSPPGNIGRRKLTARAEQTLVRPQRPWPGLDPDPRTHGLLFARRDATTLYHYSNDASIFLSRGRDNCHFGISPDQHSAAVTGRPARAAQLSFNIASWRDSGITAAAGNFPPPGSPFGFSGPARGRQTRTLLYARVTVAGWLPVSRSAT